MLINNLTIRLQQTLLEPDETPKYLKIPKVKTESAKRGFYFSGVKIYNALPTHLKTERFYLPFKQGLKEHFMD